MTPEEQAAKAAADKKAADDAAAAAESDNADEGAEDAGEGADKDSDKNKDLDLDTEIEHEKNRGADPEKARKAFQEREDKRKAQEAADKNNADADKPLTRKDIADIEERSYRRLQNDRALELAKSMASSEKEAQLIYLKWQNRSFPENLPLPDQLEEAYAITHRKKLIGERNEALRVAKNSKTVNATAAATHRDAANAGEPKTSDADKTALTAAGFVWDGAKRLYKKPLGNGKSHLYQDPKTKRTWRAA